MTWRKIHETYLIGALIFIVFSMLFFVFVYFIDGTYYNPPFLGYTEEAKTDKDVYKYGDTVQVSWDRCLNRPIYDKITRQWQFIDSLVYTLPEESSSPPNEIGCKTRTIIIGIIPTNLPVGKYYLIGHLNVPISKYRTLPFKKVTNWFEVVK
jgi:hypothetical protein